MPSELLLHMSLPDSSKVLRHSEKPPEPEPFC